MSPVNYSGRGGKKYQYIVYSVTPYNTRETRNSQCYAFFLRRSYLLRAVFITGAVYIGEGSYALFGGEIVFANNTAGNDGGAAVKCTLRCYMSAKLN